jgi:hypothetical protein
VKKLWSRTYTPHVVAVLVLFVVYEVLVHTKILDVMVQGKL